MKTLYESILDDEDNIMDRMGKEIQEEQIREYISKNYSPSDKYDIKQNNKVIFKSPVFLNESAPGFTNGEFTINMKKGFTLYVGNNHSMKNLKGLDKTFKGNLYISNTHIESLEGCPATIHGNFYCSTCPFLKSLEGGPKKVEGEYTCADTGIRDLKGAPEFIKGAANLTDNNYMTNLSGIPKTARILDISRNIALTDISDLTKIETINKVIAIDKHFKDYPEIIELQNKKIDIHFR